jgi:UDP-N-acetylglucosamine--N-acetylmuramyl-(pentapeptide) pyrophosphoryl-undecaprenol N-acetylglucosamine transferase
MQSILVCGGGTGGHLYPALALLEGLRRVEPHARLVYVGSRNGLETAVMPRYSWVEFYKLPIRGIARPGQRPLWFLWALLALAQLPVALAQALWIVLKERPKIIIGVGGYGAFAPVLWGVLLKIPCYVHEQNLVPGIVTRLFAPWAKKVFLTYPQTARWLRARHVVVTGLPVRPELLSARPDHPRFGLRSDRKTVLVFGGSRGSQTLTEAALAAQHHLSEVQFLIVTGQTSQASLDLHLRRLSAGEGEQSRRSLVPYIHEMGTALATADLVICRAGAGTLAELTALRKPAIVVPWPGAANDHQTANAAQLARLGLFSVVRESELTPHRLAQEIKNRLTGVHEGVPHTRESTNSLDFILREVLLDATSTHDTPALYRNRWRRHEWVGQSLF